MSKLISIIIPVFNTKTKYLIKCLNSVLEQTYQNWECIIINDGSTDKKVNRVLDKYSKLDSRFVLIVQENKGQGQARNAGIDIAKGNYITFLDSDDFLQLNFLEVLYNESQRNDSCITCSQVKDIVKSTFINKKISKTCYHDMKNIPEGSIKQEGLQELIRKWVVWSKLYKKSLFENIKFPSCKNEDIFVLYATTWKAKKIYLTQDTSYNYLIYKNSDIASFRNHKIDDKCLEYIFDLIDVLDKTLSFYRKYEKEYNISYFKEDLVLNLKDNIKYRRELLKDHIDLQKAFDKKARLLSDNHGEYFNFSFKNLIED